MDPEKIKKSISELLDHAHFAFTSISVSFNEKERSFWCDIATDDPRAFTGKQAECLGALSHLAKKILEKEHAMIDTDTHDRVRLVIDVNDFQKERIQNLKSTAHMMAERARYFKSNVEVDPMSAGDRRVIHEFLQSADDLQTESIGDGFTRRVMIKYIGT